MNTFWVLVCCVLMVSVSARPDVSLGYHYNPDYNSGSNLLTAPAPVASTSYYPTPSGSVGAVNQGSYDSGAAISSSGLANFLAPNYNVAGVSSASFSGISATSDASSGFANAGSFTGSGYTSGNVDNGGSSYIAGSNQGYIGGGSSGVSQGYIGSGIGTGQGPQQQYPPQYQQQPPIITKHFYVHSAPEDHENQEIVRYVTIGRPAKNYNVVFINTPSSTSSKAKIIASVAPVEERTAIYVLSKKANDLDISSEVVTPAPTAPNKPDVFYIKYKTPEEAIHAQHVIQAQYDKLGGSSSLSNEGNIPVQSVIGSVGGQTSVTSSAVSQSQGSSQATGFSSGQNLVQQVGPTQPQASYLPPTTYRRRRYYRY